MILPVSLVAGTIIGAGIFSLPYVFARVGFLTSVIYTVVFCAVFVLLHLMYGDIVLDSHRIHRFPGFAQKYFGNFGYILSLFLVTLQTFFVLTIYIVLAPSFLNFIAPSLSLLHQVLIFWFLGSLTIFLSNRRIAMAEFVATAGIGLIILLIGAYGAAPLLEKGVQLGEASLGSLLFPFAALLYAFNGRSAIPTVVHYFRDRHQNGVHAKRSIIWGTLTPALVFIVFVAGVLGLSGSVSEDGVTGLVGILPGWLLFGIGLLGFLSLWSSYFSIGRDLYESLVFDVRLGVFFGALLTVAVPLGLFLGGLQDFISLIEVVGGVFIGLEGMLMISMWRKARQSLGEGKGFLPSLGAVGYGSMMLIFLVSVVYVLWTSIF